MGDGTAGWELAAAVSEAGGLGTIGMLDPPALRAELARAREATGRPLAVNLLLPFARPEHFSVAAGADVLVTFWGEPRRRTPGLWLHQCGSVEEAVAARAAGADAVIAQGVEAGGHVRGTVPAHELLARVRAATPGLPVLLAGGVAEAGDVRRALEEGAEGVVCGTRFLLSEECRAHPAYKRRVADGAETVLTELFGLGWPAPHRVVPNEATRRWLRRDRRGPAAVRALHRATARPMARLPISVATRLGGLARPAVPLFGPASPLQGSPASALESSPLYAGETAARIADIRPAGELVRELAG